MNEYSVGVDIGGTTVKLGIFKIKGELLFKWEIATRREENGKYILEDIAKSIKEKLDENQIDISKVIGIGMGVPGPVRKDGVVLKCVNLGWGVFNVEEELSKLVGLSVKAANDANIAALGELWKGGGEGYNNIIMVTLGTGVGGGVIIDGNILSGTNGAAGEIGHIKVCWNETETCGCGKTGCLEQYASATGVVRIANRMLKECNCESSLRSIDNITAKDVFDAAKNNDEIALKVVDVFAEYLGTALAHISCVCDPEVFVIGGGVSKAGSIIIDSVKRHYKETAFHATKDVKFELATLGNDAGIYGGAKLVQ